MTKLEKLYSIIENSRDVGVKLPEDVIQQVEELEENIIKEEILPALSGDIAPRLEPIKRDLVLVVEYHPGEPIRVALSRKAKISEIIDAKTLTPRSSKPVSSGEAPQIEPHEETKQMIYEYYKERQDFLNELINNEPINETFKYKRFKTSEEKYKAIVDYFIMLVNEEQLYEFTPYMFKQFKIALSELKKIVLNKDSNNLRNIRITYSEGCKLLKHITKTSIIL